MLLLLLLREAAGEEREVRQRRGARHLLWLVGGGLAGPAAVSEVTVPDRAQPCSTQTFYAAFSLAICYPPASVADHSQPASTRAPSADRFVLQSWLL